MVDPNRYGRTGRTADRDGRSIRSIAFGRWDRPGPVLVELRRRNSVLFGVAALHAALFVVFLAGIALDPRTVGGDPAWLKPAKFAGSIALFAATLGWLGASLPVSDGTRRRVSIGVASAMVVEIALIGGQAARGVGSHFNDSTAFDAAVYSAMGATIVGATALVAWLLVRSRGREFDAPPAFARGVRFGLALFVLGAFEGGAMVALNAHAVTSGPELPFFGWVLGGDFRVAHFVGLHALQVLPLAGYLAANAAASGRLERPNRLVTLVAAGYAAVLFATFVHAVASIV